MNCKQAKQIEIIKFLANNGIRPEKENKRIALYKSPLRNDKNPSFMVDKRRNLYYDYGTGEGGSIIDLGTCFYNCGVSELLIKLENLPIVNQLQVKSYKEDNIRLLRIQELSNKHLINYSLKRCLNLSVLKRYCKEVYFQTHGKTLYAIGFKNRVNGWEIRNKFFKGAISPKDISLIKNGMNVISVFEGFIDFLSYIQLKRPGFKDSDYLILNSNTQIKKSYSILENYKWVNLFLDNDESGRKTSKEFQKRLIQPVTDYSFIYKHHTDINDFLINQT